ncbi:hypothetical protein ABIE44_001682 [Marmoricola sp. OAE513]|uniref:hypothetical protein n=1 Tax=Marmoricola sp. OAE513 TaxID=2817894 RepID=UPI001AE88B10
MTDEVQTLLSGRRPLVVVFQASSALVAGIGLAWTYYGQRVVMDVGGSCADGGPYVSAQPCPDGAGLMAVGIPVMLLFVIGATFAATISETPLPVFPMWAVLFGTLGWNFLEYGFADPKSVSWIVCGVVFWLIAAPAVPLTLGALRSRSTDRPGQAGVRVYWISIYLGLGAIGWGLGWWSFDSWT